ncbi:hypothetical protein BDV93DRAFT_516819 [Ceratobasidium sp. AG-I]|nr:hypothetical protein BDV93DRAFT_516819 [Ceratobasidium sp. AG-I]
MTSATSKRFQEDENQNGVTMSVGNKEYNEGFTPSFHYLPTSDNAPADRSAPLKKRYVLSDSQHACAETSSASVTPAHGNPSDEDDGEQLAVDHTKEEECQRRPLGSDCNGSKSTQDQTMLKA